MKVRLLTWLLLLTATVSAQTFRGTVLGTVTDATGAVVSGAQVTVRNANTGLERVTLTSEDGSYSVPELPIGSYNVTVTEKGFQSSVVKGVAVDVASARRVDAVLKPGEVSQSVVVTSDTLPLVETTSNTLGGTFTQSDVKNLPINGRDYQKLIFLTPGISGSPDQITDSPGSFGIFSMNGARGRSNNFLLDGTDMNDGYRNDPAINEAGVFGTPATILPIDAVDELRVLSNFEAEYGRSAGAVVNIVTRSGTNALHGTGIEYFRNSALDARNYFNAVSDGAGNKNPKAAFHNNQFGGSLGGPIVKDKTFFFLNYEGQRETVGVVTLGCVPEPSRVAADGGATNPVIAALLARNPWPAPNRGTRPLPTDPDFALFDDSCPRGPNATIISPSTNRVDSLISKIDQNFNSNNTLTGRYYFGDSDQSFPLALTASGGQLPGFNTATPTRVQLVSLSYVKVVSSNKVNELRYGWNRFAEQFNPQDQGFHPSSIGLNTGTGVADGGLPIILIAGGAFSQLGATSGDPRQRVDANHQLIDNFSWKLNKHDVKFGFEFRRSTVRHEFNKYFRGRLRFKDTKDPLTGVVTPALQNFLAGNVADGFQYSGDTLRHTSENSYGAYIQDTYRLRPRLTLNYGLRWDYFGVVAEKNNLFSAITNLDPTNATFTLSRVGSAGLDKLYQPDRKNFAPRVSIDWDVRGTGKTVLRSGFGVFYDSFSQDMFQGHLPYAPFFAPGPAYNPVGPKPIFSAGAVGGTIVAGSPVYGDSTTQCNFECDTFTFDRNIRTPYMENYNINLQQQIASKVVAQIGYVGSQGHRLLRFRDLNQPSQAAITAGDCPNGIPTCATTGTIRSYGAPRPYGSNPYGAFYMLNEETTGKSNFNALQTSLRISQWRGITSIVNYSWSRSFDNSSDGEDFEPNAAQPNDSTRPQLEYGPSNFDVPQHFAWIFSYQLPKMGGGFSRVKNGWGFDSTMTLQSGQPFQLNYNFQDDFSGSGNGFDRPDVVGPIKYNLHDPNNFLDLSAFAIPCTIDPQKTTAAGGVATDCVPGTRHFGNLRRNSLRGPQFKQWDFSIHKDTAITERVNMQFRAEFFNLLNHPNFASPFLPLFIADPGSNGFGFNAAGDREVGVKGYRLGATGDVGVGNPFLGGGGPRGVQLAVKFNF